MIKNPFFFPPKGDVREGMAETLEKGKRGKKKKKGLFLRGRRGGAGLECFCPLRDAAKRKKKRQITVRKMPRKSKKRPRVSGFNQKKANLQPERTQELFLRDL